MDHPTDLLVFGAFFDRIIADCKTKKRGKIGLIAENTSFFLLKENPGKRNKNGGGTFLTQSSASYNFCAFSFNLSYFTESFNQERR